MFFFAACDLEPGLALMDEIGRRALTNAFIHFTRNTSIHVFRDSLVYDLDDADSALDGDDVELGGSSRRLSHSQMAVKLAYFTIFEIYFFKIKR